MIADEMASDNATLHKRLNDRIVLIGNSLLKLEKSKPQTTHVVVIHFKSIWGKAGRENWCRRSVNQRQSKSKEV
jgi:hypothetical protein